MKINKSTDQKFYFVLESTGRRMEFFLHVLMTDFNSVRIGKYSVVRSLVSKKSHKNYSLVVLDS